MMHWRQSFRFRIMAMTIVVSGIVLLAFGVEVRWALYAIKVSTVDQNLRTLPFREFPHPEHQRGWERFSQLTDQVASRVFNGDVHLYVYGVEGKSYFPSEFWPSDRLVERLPLATGELAPPPNPEPDLERQFWRMDQHRRLGEEMSGSESDSERGSGVDGMLNRMFRRGPRPGERGLMAMGKPDVMTLMSSSGPIRFGVYKFDGYNVAMGVELSKVAQEMTHVRDAFLISAPLALIIIAAGAWVIASRAMRPVRRLTDAVSSVSISRLDERVQAGKEGVEFSELIRVYNDMLDRLERSFNQATRFSADAAHELKTPLTILQGHLETALQEAPDNSEQQRRLGLLLEETQRLRGITRRLLLLAKADAGQITITGEPSDFGSLISELVEDFEMQSTEKRFELDVGDGLAANLDRSLVTQVLQNLLSNAVKYNDEKDPWVRIRARGDDATITMEISNGGEGIPEEVQGRIFERFARVDSARNRGVDGFGLGLNLSREFARAHGGELELVGSESGETRFRLTLPKSN